MKHRVFAVVCFALSAAVQLFFGGETELFYMFLFFGLGVVEYLYSFPQLRAYMAQRVTSQWPHLKRDAQDESRED